MGEASSLYTPNEISERLKGLISADRLVELAESQIIPHYTLDGVVLFGLQETKEWLNHNLLVRHQGKHLGDGIVRIINVMPFRADSKPPLPFSLKAIHDSLIPMSIASAETIGCPGVYFLCLDGEVVYVGQSVNVFQRVGNHIGEKTFDSVFFIRVPKSDLDYVEGTLIRALSPKYNMNSKGRLVAPSGQSRPSEETECLISALVSHD